MICRNMTSGKARRELHLGFRPKSVGKGADQKLRAEAGHNDAVVTAILRVQQNAKQLIFW